MSIVNAFRADVASNNNTCLNSPRQQMRAVRNVTESLKCDAFNPFVLKLFMSRRIVKLLENSTARSPKQENKIRNRYLNGESEAPTAKKEVAEEGQAEDGATSYNLATCGIWRTAAPLLTSVV